MRILWADWAPAFFGGVLNNPANSLKLADAFCGAVSGNGNLGIF